MSTARIPPKYLHLTLQRMCVVGTKVGKGTYQRCLTAQVRPFRNKTRKMHAPGYLLALTLLERHGSCHEIPPNFTVASTRSSTMSWLN